MKRFLIILFALVISFSLFACENNDDASSAISSESVESSEIIDPTANASKVITSLDYVNNGKMGDTDGPAFAVYSKVGFNGASVDINLTDSEINTLLSDGRFVNAYCFLGLDVYEGNYWVNCADIGLCWSGENGGWHVFYNVYDTIDQNQAKWYESRKILPKNGNYRLTLTITENDSVSFTVESLNGSFKDSVTVGVKGAKKDGSNTSMLLNLALDYPENTKLDSNGSPSNDWTKITLANSDKGLYFKNLHAYNLSLFKNGERIDWTDELNSSIGIWPDKAVDGFDYSPVEVYLFDGREYVINLDMNRK